MSDRNKTIPLSVVGNVINIRLTTVESQEKLDALFEVTPSVIVKSNVLLRLRFSQLRIHLVERIASDMRTKNAHLQQIVKWIDQIDVGLLQMTQKAQLLAHSNIQTNVLEIQHKVSVANLDVGLLVRTLECISSRATERRRKDLQLQIRFVKDNALPCLAQIEHNDISAEIIRIRLLN